MKKINLKKINLKKINIKPYSSLFVFVIIFIISISCIALGTLIFSLFNINIFRADLPIVYIVTVLIVSQIVVTIVYSLYISRIARDTNYFIEGFEHIANGDYDYRIDKKLIDVFESTRIQFNKAMEELNNIEKLRSDYTANFSHEFKTPLASILGFAKILKKKDLSINERIEYINIIIEEADRLTKLSTNTLLLSKLDNNIASNKEESFLLNEQICNCVLLLENKWLAKNINFELNFPSELIYYGNKELLKEVWINIIDNAIKFSKDNANIIISSKTTLNSIIIEIKDYGIGMNEETKKHIFDRYYQGDTSHSTIGNGLGLAIVKKIIDIAKGNISIVSNINEGSTFIIELYQK